MSLAYKVEELLALRDSVSESAVSIDKFADEDVIKEHVLRPSVSANVIGANSFEKPLRPSTTPGIASAVANLKKPSPSPSVKRGKAERLLKEHGSPPGMRVTAGGRVVPSDLPPLTSTRFGSNNFKPQALRGFDVCNGLSAQTQPDVNAHLTPPVQLVGTQAVIRVGDRMYAIPAYETNYQMPAVNTPNLDNPKQPGGSVRMPSQGGMPSAPLASQASRTQSPFAGLDLPTLEAQWASKKEELRYVEQTEVLQADQQGPAWRNGMIAKKKSLILEIDALRKQISVAKDAETSKGAMAPVQMNGLPGTNAPAAPVAPPVFPAQFPQSAAPGLYPNIGVPIGASAPTPFQPFQPLMMYQAFAPAGPQGFPTDIPQFGRDSQFFVPGETLIKGDQLPKVFTQGVNVPQSPGSASRRSHAVPIKKPQEDVKKPVAQASTLDPKSPTYEPVAKTNGKTESAQDHLPPTPSPPKPSPWRSNETGSVHSNKHEDRAISQKPSLSSIDTTDFFPTNTHEHSSTRIAPNKLSKQPSCENTVVPATPDKPWSTSPWNPSSGSQSNRAGFSAQSEASRRLTSWPEAFGKQPSLQSSTIAESGGSASAPRKSSAEQTGTDLNWPPIPQKPASHAPSTYQEGYQAGLRHFGLPDNPEVLHGFMDGIAAFLKDKRLEDRKERNYPPGLFPGQVDRDSISARSSVRGYPQSTPFQDSAVGFVENIRSAKVNRISSSVYPEPVYSPKGHEMDAQLTYAVFGDAAREPYLHGRNAAMGQEQHCRQSPASINQFKDNQPHSDFVQSSMMFPRQFSGNQAGNRVFCTPVSLQRYVPAPKEHDQAFSNANIAQSARSSARQRFSGLDGAMDDLAGLVVDASLDENAPAESGEAEASCFKSSSGKGKQPASSPPKMNSGNGKDASSPAKTPGSPKKAGEVSPAKAKLEQVTNKLRRPRKDDPRTMSPEEKQKRTEKWRGRFRTIKAKEQKDKENYERDNVRKDSAEAARR